MERMECEDRITLKQFWRVAEVLDCDLQYALVPCKPVEEMVRMCARLKAQKWVNKTNEQMTLEVQQLSRDALEKQVERETDCLVRELPRDL